MTTPPKTPFQSNIVQSMLKTGLYVASIATPSYISFNIGLQMGKKIHDVKKIEKPKDFSKLDVNSIPNYIRYNNTVTLKENVSENDDTLRLTTYHNIPTDAINFIDRIINDRRYEDIPPTLNTKDSIQIIPFGYVDIPLTVPQLFQFKEINKTQLRLIKELLKNFTSSHTQ